MTLSHILLPTDFSETASHALDYARELAARFGADVHVLHVVADPTPQDWAVGPAAGVVTDLLDMWRTMRSGVSGRLRWTGSRPCGRFASVTRSWRSFSTPPTTPST